MADFINTLDVLGDDAVIDSIIDRSITEFKDDTLTMVGLRAFVECKSLKTVDLPNVTTLGESAFSWCTALETVDLPNVTSVAQYAFHRCAISNNISMAKVTSLPYQCFGYATIAKAVFPKLVVIEGQAFRYSSTVTILDLPVCTEIGGANFHDGSSCTHLILRTNNVCTIGGLNAGIRNVYVPSALIEDYKVATNWASLYASNSDLFRALEDYTVDGTITGELDETKI